MPEPSCEGVVLCAWMSHLGGGRPIGAGGGLPLGWGFYRVEPPGGAFMGAGLPSLSDRGSPGGRFPGGHRTHSTALPFYTASCFGLLLTSLWNQDVSWSTCCEPQIVGPRSNLS